MRTSDVDILIVPGSGNSGPDHWQTRWEAKLSTARRVQQDDWDFPKCPAWTARLIEAVAASTRPVVLVAHSLGVPAIAHAAAAFPAGQVVGAFLVASPSEAGLAIEPQIDPAFAPFPREPLPFPSLLVASRNDPFGDYTSSQDLAEMWGATLVDAGEAGHINVDSGFGPWPEGLMRFAGFLKSLPSVG